MPQIENHSEFSIRMACPDRWVKNRWLFKNGAQSDGHYRLTEPPEDPSDLAKLKLEFVTSEIAHYKYEHSELVKYVGIQSEYHMRAAGPSPDTTMPGWEDHLNEIVMKVSVLKGQATKLKKQIKVNDEISDYARRRNKDRAEHANVVSRLQSLPGI